MLRVYIVAVARRCVNNQLSFLVKYSMTYCWCWKSTLPGSIFKIRSIVKIAPFCLRWKSIFPHSLILRLIVNTDFSSHNYHWPDKIATRDVKHLEMMTKRFPVWHWHGSCSFLHHNYFLLTSGSNYLHCCNLR